MTVKRNGDKVILKDGKVSCGCCEEPGECCMYPAQALADGIYSENDLPDFIDFSSRYSGVYTIARNGTNYTAVVDGQTIGVLFYNSGGVGFWNFQDEGGSASGSNCLIKEQGNYPVSDQFADTYTVSGSISGTVTRESVCVWRGTGLALTNFGYQWKVNGNNKSGFQSTPVGSYAGGFTVS